MTTPAATAVPITATPTQDAPTDATRDTATDEANPQAPPQADLNALLSRARQDLDDARATITRLERRQKIDALLAESDAIDPDVARLLTEMAVNQMDAPDLRLAVDDLRHHKPYLFRKPRVPAAAPARAMPPRDTDDPAEPAQLARDQARTTGLRADLLRYLRLRRKA